MKLKNITAAAFCGFALLFTGCNSNNNRGDFAEGFEGLYVGELPCADCAGISTHATFFDNQDVAISSLYYTKDSTSSTEWGIWKVDSGLLTVTLPSGNLYYVQLSESVIMMTDSLGKESESLAQYYQLKKEKQLVARDFNGVYSIGDLSNPDAYVQTMEITPVDDENVIVEIISQGAGKGCNFKAEGKVLNNQIQIKLNQQHAKMTSTMVIRFTDTDTLNIFTSEMKDRYDLMYFCGGGGSLAGDYVRIGS